MVGAAITVVAVIVLLASVRDPAGRARALGFVYVGFSVVVASGTVFLISRLGDRLPVIAGLPVIGLMVMVAVILRLAASREFRRYRSYESEQTD